MDFYIPRLPSNLDSNYPETDSRLANQSQFGYNFAQHYRVNESCEIYQNVFHEHFLAMK
jgi:hypothetical protein